MTNQVYPDSNGALDISNLEAALQKLESLESSLPSKENAEYLIQHDSGVLQQILDLLKTIVSDEALVQADGQGGYDQQGVYHAADPNCARKALEFSQFIELDLETNLGYGSLVNLAGSKNIDALADDIVNNDSFFSQVLNPDINAFNRNP